MGADCCDHCDMADPQRGNPAYRRVLWAVLAINAVMFAVEIGAGLAAGSAALQADALDFLGDATNYAISLFVVGMMLRYRAMAALAKGGTMGLFGLWVVGTVFWHAAHGTCPAPSLWARWASRPWRPMQPRSACSGPIAAVTRTCARHGFARVMTCSATWPSCWQRLVCSAPARGGPTSSSPRSWRALRCKARGSWRGSLSANYAGRFRLRRDGEIENAISNVRSRRFQHVDAPISAFRGSRFSPANRHALCPRETGDYGSQGSELRLLFGLGPAPSECGLRHESVRHRRH